MNVEVSLLAAFGAGVLSISSPCVLPLVPIYLAHLAGVGTGEADAAVRRRIVANAAAYVAGFALVFVLLGVALGAAGMLVETGSLVAGNRFWIVRLGGALLVVLGLHQLGIIRLPLLDRERRLSTGSLPAGQIGSSFVVGVTFGAGWSPCVGPILGAILTMAAGQGSIERAGLLLTAYSLGLAVPFMAAAVAYGSSPAIIRLLNRRLPAVTSLSGGVMVALGAVMLLGLYQQFFARLVALSPWTPLEPSL
jgi:cytochrome c-type biogenesis protein